MSSSTASSKALDQIPGWKDVQSEGADLTGYPTPPSSVVGDVTRALETTGLQRRDTEHEEYITSGSESRDSDDGDRDSEEEFRDAQERLHSGGDTDPDDKRNSQQDTALSTMPGGFSDNYDTELTDLARGNQHSSSPGTREPDRTTDKHTVPTVTENDTHTIAQVGSTRGSIAKIRSAIGDWAYNKVYSASGPVKSLIDASNWYTHASGLTKSAIKATAMTMAGMAALRFSVNTAADTKRCLDEWSRPYGYMSCSSGSERQEGMIEPWWVLKGRDD